MTTDDWLPSVCVALVCTVVVLKVFRCHVAGLVFTACEVASADLFIADTKPIRRPVMILYLPLLDDVG